MLRRAALMRVAVLPLPYLPALLALLALLPLLTLWSAPARAQWRVDRVLDGDSLRVYDDQGQRVTVRLAGIDAPEKAQPYADRSRQHLRELLRDCRPQLQIHKRDRFGRAVAVATCDGRDLGLAQLEAGWAWHFRRYKNEQPAQERLAYARAEDRARESRRGLWRETAPTPPWVYRDTVR